MEPGLVSKLWMKRVLAEEDRRTRAIKKRWEYYYGDHKRPLKARIGKPDDNVILNYSKLIVDTGVDFLFGEELLWELQEGGEPTPEETWLATTWKLNRKMTFLGKLALNAGVAGHFFIKIVPDWYILGGKRYPRLVNIDAATIRKFTDPDDVETVIRYVIEYAVIDPTSEKPLNKKQVIERQPLLAAEAGGEREITWKLEWWEARGKDRYSLVRGPEEWPFSWPPIIDGQNLPNPGEPYGLSDLEDLDVNDGINAVASKINKILRYHSQPKTWGRGFSADTLEMAADNTVIIPGDKGTLQNLEMQSDLASSRLFQKDLVEAYHNISRVPRLDPMHVNVGALSGFALRILYGPLLAKTTIKQRTYGDALVELMRRLLELANAGAEHFATLHWQDPLPISEQEQALVLKIDRELELVSLQTARVKRGYKHETEKERLKEEGAEAATFGERVMMAFQRGAGGEGGRLTEGAGGESE